MKLALFQTPAELVGKAARVAWLEERLAEVAGQEIDLAILPELYLSGYKPAEPFRDLAEPIDGALAGKMAELAQKHGLAISYTMPENKGGKIVNSAYCVDKSGKIIGGHQKLVLPPGFETEHFEAGTGCSVFELAGLKIGYLICYDAEFPEAARHVALKGAELIIVPTALGEQWGWVSHSMIPTRGFENGVYLAYANHCGTENGISFLGESFISTPDGQIAARAGRGPETLIVQISKDLVLKAQARLPYLTDRLLLTFS